MHKAIFATFFLFGASSARAQAPGLPELLPPQLETDLALSALPRHLRAEATVLHLRRGGYQTAHAGGNGFTCLVRRSGAVPGRFARSVLPVCYDAEGSRTLLKAVMDEVAMLEDGMDGDAVRRAIEAGWADGRYTVPGPGVAYMLSPVFRLNGRDGGYVPHLMFYGPHLTDQDVGATEDRFDPVPFVQGPGLPSAMIVVPLGEVERAAIVDAEAALLAAVAKRWPTDVRDGG